MAFISTEHKWPNTEKLIQKSKVAIMFGFWKNGFVSLSFDI